MQVRVDGSKYLFFVPEGDYRVHIHRFGEPWLVLEAGSKAVCALMHQADEARREHAARVWSAFAALACVLVAYERGAEDIEGCGGLQLTRGL